MRQISNLLRRDLKADVARAKERSLGPIWPQRGTEPDPSSKRSGSLTRYRWARKTFASNAGVEDPVRFRAELSKQR